MWTNPDSNDGEKHEGIFYDDSDVYKAIEAIAYSLSTHPDPALERKVDEWIGKIAAAQLSDGYLNTYFTLNGLDQRWSDMDKHEDYCAGHLIEAAIAYYHTTGKRTLLDVAIRFADHIDDTFRVKGRHWVSGHEEIELALMKLYGVTHNERYLKLAQWYLDQRGHGYGRGGLWPIFHVLWIGPLLPDWAHTRSAFALAAFPLSRRLWLRSFDCKERVPAHAALLNPIDCPYPFATSPQVHLCLQRLCQPGLPR